MCSDAVIIVLGNRLFYFQTITERKIENKKLGSKKKGFLSFYSVCMFFVCVFVCLFVCGHSTDVIV